MDVGKLVKRVPEWGNWVTHNPWMYTAKDLQIGMIISLDSYSVKVLWPTGPKWEDKRSLEVIHESR